MLIPSSTSSLLSVALLSSATDKVSWPEFNVSTSASGVNFKLGELLYSSIRLQTSADHCPSAAAKCSRHRTIAISSDMSSKSSPCLLTSLTELCFLEDSLRSTCSTRIRAKIFTMTGSAQNTARRPQATFRHEELGITADSQVELANISRSTPFQTQL